MDLLDPSASCQTTNIVRGSIVNQNGLQINQSSIAGNFIYHNYPNPHPQPSARLEPSSTVPFRRDRDFVDRGDTLAQVREKLGFPAARVALVGLGGVGKSQLAIEYSYQVQERAPDTWVFWVHASNAARFDQSYKTIADRIKLQTDEKTIKQLVFNWLCDKTNGPWLIILDNADYSSVLFSRLQDESATGAASGQSECLSAFLPQAPHGSILITSRDRETAYRLTGNFTDVINVPHMDQSEAATLLKKKLRDSFDLEFAPQLLQDLDYMPLAITQAAAYMNKRAPRISVKNYIAMFRQSSESELSLLNEDCGDLRRDPTATNSIITTWQLSFEHINRVRPSASNLLSLMSFFDRQGIPEYLLRNASGDSATNVAEMRIDRDFEDDVEVLQRYSLIMVSDNVSFEMHRLVQLATKRWLEVNADVEMWRQAYTAVLWNAFPYPSFENWSTCQVLYPHAQSLLIQRPTSDEWLQKWASVIYYAAQYAGRKAEPEAAKQALTDAISVQTRVLGARHPETLRSMETLAGVLQDQGSNKAAEQIHRQVLQERETALGRKHPQTLMTILNLSILLGNRGKYKEAEENCRRALEGFEVALGKENLCTLGSLTHLGYLLRPQGKYEAAEQIGRKALYGCETALGRQHPDTLGAMKSLVGALRCQNKYDEAEPLARRAVDLSEITLGKAHPTTLACVVGLASVLRGQSRYKEAEEMYRSTLHAHEKVFGKDNPSTVTAMLELVVTILDQQRWSEAEQLAMQATEIAKRVLGDEHPNTLGGMAALAISLHSTGRYSEALGLRKKVYQSQYRILGPEHPNTLASMGDLAVSLQLTGRYSEAIGLVEAAYQLQYRILGPEHSNTLASMGNLAVSLQLTGRYSEAIGLIEAAYQSQYRILGPEHPYTQASLERLLQWKRGLENQHATHILDTQRGHTSASQPPRECLNASDVDDQSPSHRHQK